MGGLFGGGQTINNVDTQVGGFQINTATYGLTVPLILGTSRIASNIIDWYNFTPIAHTTSQSSGGKGGGEVTTTNTTWTYTVAVLLGLAEGTGNVGRVWRDKELLGSLAAAGLTMFSGARGQAPWSYTQSVAPSKALPYSGLAYVAGVVDADSGGGLPTYGFEFYGNLRDTGDGIDINPADALLYIINDLNAGSVETESLERFRKFCTAADSLISLPLVDTQKAYEIIKSICKATNTINFWSQNKLKLIPQCDERLERGGVVYEPVTMPEYDLTADDFLENGDSLVVFEREDNSEAYNHVTVEFINRANGYEVETAEYKIQSDINKRGLRSMPNVEMHYLHTKERAEYVACLLAMDSLYGRNKYNFRLGWAHCRLEPGDFVTIQDDSIGSNKIPVIISNIEEDEDGGLEVIAKGRPPGIYSPARYTAHQADRPTTDYYVSPGNVNPPVMFEPPEAIGGGLVVYIGASGSQNWGMADVWVSESGESYKNIGAITNPSRQGVVASRFTDTLIVDMSLSRAELLSGTAQDADNYNTLCYVDGELIAYEGASLTGQNIYELTGLRRGAYGTTKSAHNPGTQFLRIDQQSLFSYPFTKERIGSKIYIKFTSHNVFGVSRQSLEEVEEYTYILKGSALLSPLPTVEDLRNYYENGNMYLLWSPIADFRSPIEYEIRKGESWGSAEILGRTFNTKYLLQGNGTYWLSAAYGSAYSEEPVEIVVAGARYVKNVIALYNEKETGWTGSLSGSAAIIEDEIRLLGVGDVDDILDFDAVWNMDYYGFGPGQGVYKIPTSHKIDIGAPALCNVSVNYLFYGDTIYPTFDAVTDVDAIANWDGDYSPFVGCKVQINIDGADWTDFSVGEYYGQVFDFRVAMQNYSADVTAILSGFSFAVDVPDITESKNVTVPAGGLSILYATNFHAVPEPQITIFNAQEGDAIGLTFQGVSGFTVQVKNAGIGVERDINYMAQKY